METNEQTYAISTSSYIHNVTRISIERKADAVKIIMEQNDSYRLGQIELTVFGTDTNYRPTGKNQIAVEFKEV